MKRLAWTIVCAALAAWAPGCSSDEGSGPKGRGRGAPCTAGEDCQASLMCDPEELVCAEFECGRDLACPDDGVCLPQTQTATGGACYPRCTPFVEPCGDDLECVPLTYDNAEGFCVPRGPGGICDPDRLFTTTGCPAGELCVAQSSGSGACEPLCDMFAADPGCPEGLSCTVEGTCYKPPVDPAPIGEACADTAEPRTYCGAEPGNVKGMCLEWDGTLECLQLCRTATNDCGGGSVVCLPILTSSDELGACVDVEECGNGGEGECAACREAALKSGGCCGRFYNGCSSSTPCGKLLDCIGTCAGDQGCIDDCSAVTPNGVAAVNVLLTCLYGDEQQEFAGACGAVCE